MIENDSPPCCGHRSGCLDLKLGFPDNRLHFAVDEIEDGLSAFVLGVKEFFYYYLRFFSHTQDTVVSKEQLCPGSLKGRYGILQEYPVLYLGIYNPVITFDDCFTSKGNYRAYLILCHDNV